MPEIQCPSCGRQVPHLEGMARDGLSCPDCGEKLTEDPKPSQGSGRPSTAAEWQPQLPKPLADPLRLLARFVGWLMIVEALLAVAFAVACPLLTSGRRDGWGWWSPFVISFFSLALPVLLCYWRVLPHRPVNALYLRSFRNDSASWPIRKAAHAALGSGFRLSGIRDPRRRWPRILRYLDAFLFAMRYCSPKFMNLEAGPDWKARLWASFGHVRCALIDVAQLTPFVLEEINLCYECLGPERILFIGDGTRSVEGWQQRIAEVVRERLAKKSARIQVAIWENTAAGRRAFADSVRSFAKGLPAGTAQVSPDSLYLAAAPESLEQGPPAWDGHGWVELLVGVFLSSLILSCYLSLQPQHAAKGDLLASSLKLLWQLPLLGLSLAEVWFLVQYVIDCGSNRERFLTVSTFGLAGLWLVGNVVVVTMAVSQIRAGTDALRNANNLKQIGFAMQNYAEYHGDAFPPAEALGPIAKTGKPGFPVSWRVLVLPYLGVEENALFARYRMDEPWDGPNNISLLEMMPAVYALPGKESTTPGDTYYRVFVSPRDHAAGGPSPAFMGGDHGLGVKLGAGFPDGMSQTILVVEAAEAVPWTKPDELVYEQTKPLPALGGHYRRGFHALLADGSVRIFPNNPDETKMRAWITRDGAEFVDADF